MFSHPDEHQIANGSPLTTLPVLGLEWSVAFKVKLSSFVGYAHCLNLIEESGQRGIARIELTGGMFQVKFGYPYLTLLTATADSIRDDSTPPVGVWIQIEIAQVLQGGATKIVFLKNGAVVGMLLNPQPLYVFGVDLFAVKTGVKAQPGTVKELAIRTDLSGNNIS